MFKLKAALMAMWAFLAVPALGNPDPEKGAEVSVVAATGFFPEYGPKIGDFSCYLLGGWSKGAWLSDKAAASLLRGGDPYRFYSLAGELGRALGNPPQAMDTPCQDTLEVTFANPPRIQSDVVAVRASFNPLPRKPKVLSTEQQVYKDATAAILREKGIAEPQVRLTQVIRVDLDGDGTEEVLVSATHYARGLSSRASPGDYSLVFLRRLLNGRLLTRVIEGDFFPKGLKFGAAGEHRVAAVLDLNGDGVMEIVLIGRYYEGDWVAAYRLEGDKVVKIFTTGCGV